VRRIATQVLRIDDGRITAQGGVELLDAGALDMLA
jgi:hypothetical protein